MIPSGGWLKAAILSALLGGCVTDASSPETSESAPSPEPQARSEQTAATEQKAVAEPKAKPPQESEPAVVETKAPRAARESSTPQEAKSSPPKKQKAQAPRTEPTPNAKAPSPAPDATSQPAEQETAAKASKPSKTAEPKPAASLAPLNSSGVRPTFPENCPPVQKTPKPSRKEAYEGVPFKPGEIARYEVKYAGVLAGHATIEVRKPQKIGDVWHRVFHAEARTGDWYKAIFVVHDEIHSVGRPWDFGISRFFMKQDEGTLFGKRYRRSKWVDFDHDKCKVYERTIENDKPEKKDSFDLVRGANDVLGAYFNIRARDLRKGVMEFAPVYTSEKNWLLEAQPLGEETVEVKAGKFKAMKVKLQTYIGQELQQKGDVYMWIATDHPHKPMVQVQAEVKIGSIWVELAEFKPGSP